MALIAHQTQVKGSFPALSLKPKSWTKGVKRRSSVHFQLVGRLEKYALKHHFHPRGQPIILPRDRALRVLSFKGNAQNDEPYCRDSGSKLVKSSLHLSSTQEESEEIITETPSGEKHLSHAAGDGDVTVMQSLEAENLFRKWLMMLRTQTSGQSMYKFFRRKLAQDETSENQSMAVSMRTGQMLKATLTYFLGLDAAVSLPLLIFIPWFLMVKVLYGAEVTRELTPLWVLGPLILALYIKIVQGLCSFYVFCFMQAIRLVKNLPTYFLLVYNYIAEGKLKAFLWAHFCKPIIDIKNLDYKELLRHKFKQLEEWAVEKYLDYVESIWPYYCRTIRFLKKANLI